MGACEHKQLGIAKFMIDQSKKFGIDLNAPQEMNIFEENTFHYVCHEGYLGLAESIMEKASECGVDLNAKDKSGKTAFYKACASDHLDVVKLLLENASKFSINLNVSDKGWTAFYAACCYGRDTIVEELLKFAEAHPKQLDLTIEDIRGYNGYDIAKQQLNKEELKTDWRNQSEIDKLTY